MKEYRTLALFVNGTTDLAPDEVFRLLDKLTENYDMCVVYQSGDPSLYVNSLVIGWAFRHHNPVTFGTCEDEERMVANFGSEDHRAVVTFDNGHAKRAYKTSANRFASVPGTQVRSIMR